MNITKSLNLAKKLDRKGDYDGSREQYESILREFPKNKRALNAKLELETRVAKIMFPQLTQSLVSHLLGLHSQGRTDEALEQLHLVSLAYPNSAVVHNSLAVCLFAKEDLKHAILSCKRAIAADPNYAQPYSNLSLAYRIMGNFEEALRCSKKAIEIQPDFADAHLTLALVQMNLNQRDEAQKSLQLAEKLDPNSPVYPHFSAENLKQQGRFPEAIEAFDRALSIDSNYAPSLIDRAGIAKDKPREQVAKEMTVVLENQRTSKDHQIDVCFALSEIHEKLDQFDLSYNYLEQGSTLMLEGMTYYIEQEQKYFQILKDTYESSVEKLADISGSVDSGKRPIFIIGMPRSGTSLVEQILASHSQVYGAGELENIQTEANHFLTWRHNLNDPLKGQAIKTKNLVEFGQSYLQQVDQLGFAESVFTDKTTLNFIFIGFILKAIPNARFINLNRDPRAVCWSIYRRRFMRQNFAWGYDQKTLAQFYHLYLDMMDFWKAKVPERIYDLDYEEMTVNQEAETRKLLEFCDLEWQDNCLNFHDSKRAVTTASVLQVRKKMYQGSSEAWRPFEPYIQTLLDGLKTPSNVSDIS